jgi:hypothetical protein
LVKYIYGQPPLEQYQKIIIIIIIKKEEEERIGFII